MRVLQIPNSTVQFGALVEDYDPTKDLNELQQLVLEKLVVVVRDQSNLSPKEQYELTKSFDPASESYGHGHNIALMSKSILQSDLISIPAQPQVKLLGNGDLYDHEGLSHSVLKHPQHFSFHKEVISPEDTAGGFTRFYRWHMDAALYQYEPAVVTTLLALKVPVGPAQTIRYDDGSGDELAASLGTTAFVSGEDAFEALSAEQKAFALKTMIKYAPHPYIWIKNAKAHSTGLGIVSEGLELPVEELPPIEEEHIKVYPMVWRNALNGKPSLQIHGCCVLDLIVDGVPMGDLAQVRAKVYELQRPGIAPSRILAHEWKEGDLVLFSNRSVWHTVVGSLAPDVNRVYHQCNVAGSSPPLPYQ